MAKDTEKTTPAAETAGEQEPKAADDADQALDSFLSRESAPKKQPKHAAGKAGRTKVFLIAVIVAVVVLVGVIIFLNNRPYPQGESDEYIYSEAWTVATVDEAGMHTVEVPTNADGKPRKNGAGTLIDYTPSGIASIRVNNAEGSFTILAHTRAGEATEYTLEGYDDFALQLGAPDKVANDAGNLSFTKIAAVGKDLADFGLDNPRAVVIVTFTDGTTALIHVGGEAAASAGTYISFGGSDAVYLVDDEAVDSFFSRAADFISLEITPGAESVDTAAFDRLSIDGSHFPEPIVLEPNDDPAVSYSYRLTSPRAMFADAVASADIAGSVRDLYAEEVVAVNNGGADAAAFLAPYGLGEDCYARIVADYPDTTVCLRASAPDAEGYIYLVNASTGKSADAAAGRVVYRIQVGAVSWVSASLDALRPDTVLSVNRSAVDSITLIADGRTYAIDVNTDVRTVVNDAGDEEEITTTEAYYSGKLLDEAGFIILLQNLAQTPNAASAGAADGKKLLEVRYTYSTGRAPDTLVFADTGEKNAAVTLNGAVIGSTPKSYVDSLKANVADVVAGKLPKSL